MVLVALCTIPIMHSKFICHNVPSVTLRIYDQADEEEIKNKIENGQRHNTLIISLLHIAECKEMEGKLDTLMKCWPDSLPLYENIDRGNHSVLDAERFCG